MRIRHKVPGRAAFPDDTAGVDTPRTTPLGGYQMLVRAEVMRAKFRNSFEKPQALIPGKVARSVFVIDADGVIRHRDVRPIGLIRPKDDDIIRAIRAAQK